MNTRENRKRIIAFDVRSRSFAFSVFEGPNDLLDFGLRSFRKGANAVLVPAREKLATLFDEFSPSAVVHNDSPSRKSKWKLRIGDALLQESQKRRIPVRHITRGMVKKAFQEHDGNKHEIATVLAQRFAVLATKLPRKRKCWQSEDYRMSIFDATALGVAYLTTQSAKTAHGARRGPAAETILKMNPMRNCKSIAAQDIGIFPPRA
jgi:hypothetical protein